MFNYVRGEIVVIGKCSNNKATGKENCVFSKESLVFKYYLPNYLFLKLNKISIEMLGSDENEIIELPLSFVLTNISTL